MELSDPKEEPVISRNEVTFKYLLFLVLVFISGIVEAFSYAHLGIFCGYMSGTIIIFGINIVNPGDQSVVPPIVSFFSFCVGSFVSGKVIKFLKDAGCSVLRRTQITLGVVFTFLLCASFVSAFENLLSRSGEYVVIVFSALALSFEMTAGVALGVPFLGSLLATNTVNSLFSDNPFNRKNAEKTRKKISMILSLLLGSICGSSLAVHQLWTVPALGCGVTIIAILFIEAFLRYEVSSQS